MQQLQQSPEYTLVVGDMPVDILMGSRAHCPTVGVTYGNSTPAALTAAGATHLIPTFPHLLPTVSLD